MMALNWLLLALIGANIAGMQLLDRSGTAVEASVRRYATAVSNADLDAAMAEIAPARRAQWTDWVHGQLGNVYDLRGIAVRSPSVVQRMLNNSRSGPFEVTAVMDVNRDTPDEFYQPTVHVSVEQVDGRWYLAKPLLGNEKDCLTSLSCDP
ncbi:MAG: hypothetical protein ACR2IK_18825 [Chloroflexota bacterium]